LGDDSHYFNKIFAQWLKSSGNLILEADDGDTIIFRFTDNEFGITADEIYPLVDADGDLGDIGNGKYFLNVGGHYFRTRAHDDVDAPNNSIYYSNDQSFLAYKDGTGTVHSLEAGSPPARAELIHVPIWGPIGAEPKTTRTSGVYYRPGIDGLLYSQGAVPLHKHNTSSEDVKLYIIIMPQGSENNKYWKAEVALSAFDVGDDGDTVDHTFSQETILLNTAWSTSLLSIDIDAQITIKNYMNFRIKRINATDNPLNDPVINGVYMAYSRKDY